MSNITNLQRNKNQIAMTSLHILSQQQKDVQWKQSLKKDLNTQV